MRTNNHSNNAVVRLPLKVGSGCFRCCAFRYSVYPNSDIRNVQIGLLTECNTQAITESANMLLLVIEIFCLLSLSIDTDTFRRTTDANILKLLGANRPLLQVGFCFFFWLNLSSLLAYQTGAYPSFLLREAISSKKKTDSIPWQVSFPTSHSLNKELIWKRICQVFWTFTATQLNFRVQRGILRMK